MEYRASCWKHSFAEADSEEGTRTDMAFLALHKIKIGRIQKEIDSLRWTCIWPSF